MVDGIPERRALELLIRRSEAEERLLERRSTAWRTTRRARAARSMTS